MTKNEPMINFCFTVNNYIDNDMIELETFYKEYCKYLIYGKEEGLETHTKHLQGYAQLKKKTRFNTIKKNFIKGSHIEKALGSAEDNYKYCTKEGDFKEYGMITKERSNGYKKNNLREEIKKCKTFNEVLEIEGVEKYLKFSKEYFYSLDKRRPEDYENIELKDWQRLIVDYLEKEGTNREILFVIDSKGGLGKTFLCSYLLNTRDDVFVSENGKTADILYNYANNLKRNILIDIKRCVKLDDINYGVLESLINPFFTSTKYETKTIIKPFKSNMIVFMNNTNLNGLQNYLSKDRIKILDLNCKDLIIINYDEYLKRYKIKA